LRLVQLPRALDANASNADIRSIAGTEIALAQVDRLIDHELVGRTLAAEVLAGSRFHGGWLPDW
jgi:hypothetical protein